MGKQQSDETKVLQNQEIEMGLDWIDINMGDGGIEKAETETVGSKVGSFVRWSWMVDT